MVCLIATTGEYAIRKLTARKGRVTECNISTSDLYILLGKDINITKKNTDGMVVPRKEVGIKVNADRTKYKHMLMF
jgi:hypothetical protein